MKEESEESESHSVMSDSWRLHRLTVHGILRARILEWVAFPFSRGSNPGIEPRSPTLQADSLPAEPQGKSCILNWIVLPVFEHL